MGTSRENLWVILTSALAWSSKLNSAIDGTTIVKKLLLSHMTLVDKALIHCCVLQEDRRERLLQQYRNDLGLVEDIY